MGTKQIVSLIIFFMIMFGVLLIVIDVLYFLVKYYIKKHKQRSYFKKVDQFEKERLRHEDRIDQVLWLFDISRPRDEINN